MAHGVKGSRWNLDPRRFLCWVSVSASERTVRSSPVVMPCTCESSHLSTQDRLKDCVRSRYLIRTIDCVRDINFSRLRSVDIPLQNNVEKVVDAALGCEQAIYGFESCRTRGISDVRPQDCDFSHLRGRCYP